MTTSTVTSTCACSRQIQRLTTREIEIMHHLTQGSAYKQIAAELVISIKTVESHASAVLRKLQVANRTELTRWAALEGVLR